MAKGDPSTNYLTKSTGGRGTSSVVKGGGSGKLIASGIKEGDRAIGTKRFDLTPRSLNRGRKM